MPRRLFVLVVAGVLLGLFSSSPAVGGQFSGAVSQGNEKIDALLLAELNDSGTADFLVSFTEQADLSPADQMDWLGRGRFVYNILKETSQRSQAVVIPALQAQGVRYQSFIAGNTLYVWDGNAELLEYLAGLESINHIEAARVYPLTLVDGLPQSVSTTGAANDLADPYSSASPEHAGVDSILNWGISDIGADQFWTMFNARGQGIVVATIDTGAQWNHPALDQAFKCTGDPSNPACWFDPAGVCGGEACDNQGHGTLTLGNIAGDDDPALPYNVGVAPEARWIACKGCEASGCTTASLLACADWALAPGGNPDNRPNIIHNGWTTPGGDTWFQNQARAWQSAGIFSVFPAGNGGPACGTLRSPGEYQDTFSAVAYGQNRLIADFSSRGPSIFGDAPFTKPNIAAPGVNVCSTTPGNGYTCGFSSTSAASAHTAGAVALLWSCDPFLVGHINQTTHLLRNTADIPPDGVCGHPNDNSGNYTYGNGYLNILQAGINGCNQPGGVEGHVTNAITGSPIAGAEVQSIPIRENSLPIDGYTDPNGYYTMTLAAGTYDIVATHTRYTTARVDRITVQVGAVTTVNLSMTPRGRVWGFVTDADTGMPLAGVQIKSDGTLMGTSDPNGYYEIYLDAGTHQVTAELIRYTTGTASVNVSAGGQYQRNFILQAQIALLPSPLQVSIPWGTSTSLSAVLVNRLQSSYPFHFIELPDVTIFTDQASEGEGSLQTTGPIPGWDISDQPLELDELADQPSVPQSAWGLGAVIPSGNQYQGAAVSVDQENYYLLGGYNGNYLDQTRRYNRQTDTWTSRAAMPVRRGNFQAEYDFESGLIYAAGGYNGAYLDRLDVYNATTNQWSSRASLPVAKAGSNGAIVGDRLYVMGGNGGANFNETQVYDISSNSWSFGTPMPIPVHRYGGDATYAGNIYIVGGYGENTFLRYDPIQDSWQAGPPLTQARNSPVVAVTAGGVIIVWGGGDGWVPRYDGEMYDLANWPDGSWTPISGPGPAYPTTRAASVCAGNRLWVAGGYPAHSQNQYWEGIDCFAPSGDVSWLDERPRSGTVAPGLSQAPEGTLNVTVAFTATVSAGVNNPGTYQAELFVSGDPELRVPVTMNVLPTANMGELAGMLTDSCSQEAIPEVLVNLPGGNPITHTLTDLNGFYHAWLEAGSYAVQFSRAGYASYSTSAVITAGQTTTLSVSLQPDRPCMQVQPALLEATLISGTAVYTHPTGLTITNLGMQDLSFGILEGPGQRAQTGVLLIQDSAPWGLNSIETILNNQSIPYTILSSAQIPSADFSPYRMIIVPSVQGLAYNTVYNANLGKFEQFIDNGGVMLLLFAEMSLDTPYRQPPFGSTSNFQALSSNFIVEPAHPILAGVPNPYTGNSASHNYLTNLLPGDRTLVTGGSSPGGATIMIERAHGAGLLVAGGQAFEWGYAQNQPAGIILENMIPYYYFTWRPVLDIPWVWEQPISGTVPSGAGSLGVDILLTSLNPDTSPMPLGTYTATLYVKSLNSPDATFPVQVRMDIVGVFRPPTAAFETDSPNCLGESTTFTNTTSLGNPANTWYSWDFGDGITSTEVSPLHTYLAVGTYPVTLTACNDIGCTQASATVEVQASPIADFTYLDSGLSVAFTNLSTSADSYSWSFGDGATSTEVNPTHIYSGPGIYTVTLMAGNACGVDYASQPIEVFEPAELILSKSAAPDPVQVGELLTYTLTAANAGPGPAAGVLLTDTLPVGVSLTYLPPECSGSGSLVVCDLGQIPAAGTRVVEFAVHAPQIPGLITNRAVVSSDRFDPDLSNNSASASTSVFTIYLRRFLPVVTKY